MNKQFVSLDEALGYLQFINNDKDAFTEKTFKPMEATNQKRIRDIQLKSIPQLNELTYNKKINQVSGNEESMGKKTLNKNRAIKRIIDTSKQILQNNYKYEQPAPADKKSYITQFNIYLKQYNRLSEQILAQEQERQKQVSDFRQEQQKKLQQVYKYTVSQDFRQLIEVSILKDKINKTNVKMVMETFKLSLIVLKNNQIRIFETNDEDSAHRDIKLHEIQNVDYFSQPYIFTVMTIIKDKSSGFQFLCFKFDSLEKQHKWDRAVYCNFIVRKMKRKNRYFLNQFPQKQSQKRNDEGNEHIVKKRDDFKAYDIQRKKIIKSLVSQKQKEKQGTRMASAGMDTQREPPTSDKRDNKMERFNTDNQITVLTPSANYNLLSTKNSNQKQFFESNFKGGKGNDQNLNESELNKQQNQPNNQNPVTTQKNNGVKNNSARAASQSPLAANSQLNQNVNPSQNAQPNDTPIATGNKSIPPRQPNPQVNETSSQKSNSIRQSNLLPKKQSESQILNQESMSKALNNKIINPYTLRKIQLKEKHKLGIKAEKIKFFVDKPKLIYLNNDQIQYWDYVAQTFHKSQKKVISLNEIKSYKVAKNKDCVIYFQLTTKSIQFLGATQDIEDIVEWIQLQKKEKTFIQQNIPKPQQVNIPKGDKNQGGFIL